MDGRVDWKEVDHMRGHCSIQAEGNGGLDQALGQMPVVMAVGSPGPGDGGEELPGWLV